MQAAGVFIVLKVHILDTLVVVVVGAVVAAMPSSPVVRRERVGFEIGDGERVERLDVLFVCLVEEFTEDALGVATVVACLVSFRFRKQVVVEWASRRVSPRFSPGKGEFCVGGVFRASRTAWWWINLLVILG